jgi:hypothetical protein
MKHRLYPALNKLTEALLALLIGSATVGAQSLPPEILLYADTVYVNATIVTLDDHAMNDNPGTIAEAMAVRDEVIIAIGKKDAMLKMAGPKTKVVDLQGKTVLPGIVESHVHPMGEAEKYAREIFKLRNTPEGFALDLDVGATEDETMAKVAKAMEVLLANTKPKPEDWINISLVHNPELGFATPADVSTLMSAPKLTDVSITKEDVSEIVSDYPFVLSSASSILDAPKKNIWYHITVGPDGQPVTTPVVELK